MSDTNARDSAIQLLLGDHERASAAAGFFTTRSAWTTAVILCSDWATLPALQRRLAELGVTLEGEARQTFRRRANAVFLQSASRLSQGARALASLHRAGIDAVALKGVAAIAAIYGGADGRTIGDTDVLVRRADAEQAVAVLEQAGFRLDSPVDLATRLDTVRRHPNAGNESVSMFGEGGSEIDLHWKLGRVDVEAVLAGARPAAVYGVTIAAVRAGHGFLLGAHHILRNGFELDRAMRDLIDGRAWLEAVRASGEWGPVIKEAREWGLAAPALAMLQILERTDPAGAAAAFVAEFADGIEQSERRVARALAECFWLQRTTDGWNADLPRLFDRARLLQFTGRMVGRRASSSDGLPLGRLYRLGRALPRTRWRLVRALRQAQDAACRAGAAARFTPIDARGE